MKIKWAPFLRRRHILIKLFNRRHAQLATVNLLAILKFWKKEPSLSEKNKRLLSFDIVLIMFSQMIFPEM